MSNFTFNDNYSNNGREPINIYFREDEKKPQKNIALIVCAIIFLVASICMLISGILISTSSNEENEPKVYTNVIYASEGSNKASSATLSVLGTRAEIIESIRHSVVKIQTQSIVSSKYVTSSAGSGVIIGSYEASDNTTGYYVITNAHVVEGTSSYEVASYIKVLLTDGTSYDAQVRGYDKVSDIAVLMIEENERKLPCAKLATSLDNLSVGDEVIAIGNPLGTLGGTVTNGYISALDREIEIENGVKMNLLQTDAAINPGNSGGGLFNLNGELVGIVNAKSSGVGIEGIGFAIPSDDAIIIAKDLINYTYVTGRPTLGLEIVTNGQYPQVMAVDENGPNEGKFNQGDKIIGIRNVGDTAWYPVTTDSLASIISQSEIGDVYEVYVQNAIYGRSVVQVEVYETTPNN
ncbi:MAG: trypsin-like peptidase domain-containing protein [Clostridia bacterium]|nr:trypsin-like peptidase domain-containing protein [Clostridia bacterium]